MEYLSNAAPEPPGWGGCLTAPAGESSGVRLSKRVGSLNLDLAKMGWLESQTLGDRNNLFIPGLGSQFEKRIQLTKHFSGQH